ncbi:MAG: hypothetical protein ACD_7C00502G0007 [uncultured bacterium]|nr:MAG: hypothetical protein ACD_7C00502G0007 [uncultured bacterium]
MNIQRNLYDEIKKSLQIKEILLIVGPRQAGKTTLMNKLRDFLKLKGEKTVLLNLDIEQDAAYFVSQDSLVRKLELEFGKEKGFVFIDEIQRKENAGLFLKGIYDMDLPYKFIISGSGSLELKEKIHESLAGRKRIFELSTITFKEFVNFKTEYKYADKLNDFFSIENELSLALLNEYLNFGGYPRVVLADTLEEKNKVISEIYRSYAEKDIAYFLGTNKIDKFSLMIKLLADQSGKIINYSRLSKETGISFQTLKNYLWYAEKTFSIRTIPPYFRNKHKEITRSPLAYFYDLGMRNFSLGLFGNLTQPEQIGFVFQNLIANNLQERLTNTAKNLGFWRTLDKAEVDFIINDGNHPLPIEVKYSRLKKPQMTRSMGNFIKAYSPSEAWVINLTLETEIRVKDTTVKFIPFWKL